MGKVKSWWMEQIEEVQRQFHMNEITRTQFINKMRKLNAPEDEITGTLEFGE